MRYGFQQWKFYEWQALSSKLYGRRVDLNYLAMEKSVAILLFFDEILLIELIKDLVCEWWKECDVLKLLLFMMVLYHDGIKYGL